LIQELTHSSDLPPVVMHPQGGACETQVAIMATCPGGKSREVICRAKSIEVVQTEFSKRFQNYSTITFTTDSDRPGLLSEVTDLLTSNGVNIVYAKVSTDTAKQQATHVYSIQDLATGECVPAKILARLEAGFASLQVKSAPIPTVLRSEGDADSSARADVDYLVRLACPGNIWERVAELDPLRESIRELTGSASSPAVDLVQSGGSEPRFEVVAFSMDKEVVCSGPTVEAVLSQLSDMIGGHSMVTFRTNNDRPGLLAEVSGLLKLHGTNILNAEVSTDASSRRAVHVYKLQDASTGRRLSDSMLAQVEADFKKLGEAAK